MHHYTYMIVLKNLIDSRSKYIGVRSSKCDPTKDKYYGSSKLLRAYIKEHGVDSVEKLVLSEWETREDALSHEILLHDIFDVGRKATPEARANISKGRKGIEPWNKGKPFSEEHRRKLSEAKKGKPSWNKGISPSESTKEKMRQNAKIQNETRERDEKGRFK